MDYKLDKRVITNEVIKQYLPETYSKYIGKDNRIWIVGNSKMASSFIFVSARPCENEPGYKGFRGFGGGTLSFKLDNNEVIELQGPWHSNSDSLYVYTGIDVRNTSLTWGVISEERTSDDNYITIMKNVIYIDDEPKFGKFSRIKELAKEIGGKFYYMESAGGSSNGPIN